MAKKHVGIGIAAVAASAGAATYMKKKAQKKQKKKQMEIRYSDYQNTERGKQVKNKKGIYYSNGNYEAFAKPEKPEGVEEKSAYIVGSGLWTAWCRPRSSGSMGKCVWCEGTVIEKLLREQDILRDDL